MKTIVSFDFDDTLAEYTVIGWGARVLTCIPQFIELLKEYHALGCECIVLTARTPCDEYIQEIEDFLNRMDVADCVTDIVFTAHQPKGPFAAALGVRLHYDDSEEHLESVRAHGIPVVDSRLSA